METLSLRSSSAEAAHVHAIRLAATAVTLAEWSKALDHLERAGHLGSNMAQASLVGLSGDWALAGRIAAGENAGALSWSQMRSSLRIEQWLATPKPAAVSADPRMAVIDDFAPAPFCDWLIARARPRLGASTTYEQATGKMIRDPGRTNTEFAFTVEETDVIVAIMRARIAAITAFPLRALEGTTILHYEVGQEFLSHYDFFDDTSPGFAKEIAGHGQRALTFLVSLNDGYEGGETDFPLLGKRYRGRKGTAFCFFNVTPDGAPDKRMLHAGLAPTKGEKWLLSQWLRAPVTQGTARAP